MNTTLFSLHFTLCPRQFIVQLLYLLTDGDGETLPHPPSPTCGRGDSIADGNCYLHTILIKVFLSTVSSPFAFKVKCHTPFTRTFSLLPLLTN